MHKTLKFVKYYTWTKENLRNLMRGDAWLNLKAIDETCVNFKLTKFGIYRSNNYSIFLCLSIFLSHTI
ncbi:hypothetical protein HanPI659440_Chr15g0605931 [Helianthus annuus]|nr:hypothetical protein HanPI659440_Chr15g0605931 [Helianthus annuus]